MEHERALLAMHGGDVNATLCDISRDGGGEDARFLLRNGADANHRGERRLTVLGRAARNGHADVVEALLDAGADGLGDALVCAAIGGHTSVLSLLLDRDANVHFSHDAPLFWAAQQGYEEAVTLLLERGATATERALEVALRHEHEAVAALLRKRLEASN